MSRKTGDGRRYVPADKAKAAGWPLASLPGSIRIARAYAVALTRKRPDLTDDMVGVAYLALTDAERTFRPELGASWTTHFKRRVWCSIADALRVEYQQGLCGSEKATPLNAVSPIGPGDEPFAADGGPGRVDDRDEVDRMIRTLTPKEAEVMRLVYGGLNQEAAAERVGLSKSRVSGLLGEAFAKLRQDFGG